MTRLFSPLDLRDTTIPNRVMVSPMCQYSCEQRDGLATDWHRTHLGSRAVGGAGLVMTEATAVEPRGRISPEDLGIWSDEHADALRPITEFVREQGSVPAIQLAHAGRKAATSRPWEGHDPLGPDDGGWAVVGPTEDPWPYEGEAPPTERLSVEEIESVIDSFRTAAERALNAGFEVTEVHAAHGYLLHEFLSPVTNTREDDYGGDFEGRTRLLREVTQTVRDVWPDEKPVFVRISATDWLPDRESWTLDDSVRLADRLPSVSICSTSAAAASIPTPVPSRPVRTIKFAMPSAFARRPTFGSGRSAGSLPPNRPRRCSQTSARTWRSSGANTSGTPTSRYTPPRHSTRLRKSRVRHSTGGRSASEQALASKSHEELQPGVCRSARHRFAPPAGVLTGPFDQVGPTRWTVVGRVGLAPGDVDRAAALHARIRDDCHAIRTHVEVVDREVSQGFELFVQCILVDDRLTALARLHSDAYWPM